ncbi:MAG: hypothetical protein JNL14_11590 [Devosia sp.]|uniref:hypothetical protein n=1 Tax=Devosia sp. TaxID=1871048 RepID=UPI001A4E1178|nr:hypothetical protein [Devosia sp.]MBL8598371.1 hypothetical protein [Devosia sp.]
MSDGDQMTTKVIKLPQYTSTFLARSFGLTQEQALVILARSGEDRIRAAEGARLERQAGRSTSSPSHKEPA